MKQGSHDLSSGGGGVFVGVGGVGGGDVLYEVYTNMIRKKTHRDFHLT